jgi:hypothetical protein
MNLQKLTRKKEETDMAKVENMYKLAELFLKTLEYSTLSDTMKKSMIDRWNEEIAEIQGGDN